MVVPETMEHMVPITHPKQWKKGTGMHRVSSVERAMISAMLEALPRRLLWVSITLWKKRNTTTQ